MDKIGWTLQVLQNSVMKMWLEFFLLTLHQIQDGSLHEFYFLLHVCFSECSF